MSAPDHRPLTTDHYLLLCRVDADEFATPALLFKLHHAGDEREEGVVGAEADIVARLEPRAALAHQNLAARHQLPAEPLDAQSLGIRIAPVARTAYAFLMCHDSSSISLESGVSCLESEPGGRMPMAV